MPCGKSSENFEKDDDQNEPELDYAYLHSTPRVVADFVRYTTFSQDKKAFESVPNVNFTRSINEDKGDPITPPIVSHECARSENAG
jgi:hypothetical protein